MAQLGMGMLSESGSALLGISYLGEQAGVWAPELQCGFEGAVRAPRCSGLTPFLVAPRLLCPSHPETCLLPLPLTPLHPSLSF